MAISSVGSARFKVYGVLLLVNTIVLVLSAHINHFQEFFYRADVFPLALSLVTMIFVPIMIALDVGLKNAFTARPPFELAWLFILGKLWLSFNAFSTSRWRYVTMGLCGSIPSDAQYAPYRTWCHELLALRVLVWVEWFIFLVTFAVLLRWTITQHSLGRRGVWSIAFSRVPTGRGATNSEFLQWEKFTSPPFPQSPQSTSPSRAQHMSSPERDTPRSIAQYPQYLGEQHMSRAQYMPPSQTQLQQPSAPLSRAYY